jgi:Zn-dependent protease/predicted transcriptional regulator
MFRGEGIKLGRLFGIPLVADWSWLIMMVLIWTVFRANYARVYPEQATVMAVSVACGFFLSVLVHELSHSLVAKARGLPVTRIRLYIFGGASELGTDTARPIDELLVTIVGPGSSLVLALVCRVGHAAASGPMTEVLGYLAGLNLFVGLFNLVPAFPLDGGRILRAAVWGATSDRDRGTYTAARAGQVFAVILIGGGVILSFRDPSALWFCFVGWMIGGTASRVHRELTVRSRLKGVTAADLMWTRPLAVHPDEPLARVAYLFAEAPHPAFPVVDGDGRVIGLLTPGGAQAAAGGIPLEHSNKRVGDAMEPIARAVHPWATGEETLEALQAAGGYRVVVVDAWGRLVGLVTADGIVNPTRGPHPGRTATGA